AVIWGFFLNWRIFPSPTDSMNSVTTDAATDVGDAEIRWAIEHAPPAVRELVGRFPECTPGRTRPAVLRRRLDEALRT
ncbi:hypothetical protein ACWC5I_31600, partial [Kitasatospora sp. NPDC001574]